MPGGRPARPVGKNDLVNEHRFLNQAQPPTLVNATILCYISAAFALLFGGLYSLFGIFMVVALGLGGYGIANSKKWGYALAAVGAVIQFGLTLYWVMRVGLDAGLILNLLFDGALVALLFHPMSRDYQRIWFDSGARRPMCDTLCLVGSDGRSSQELRPAGRRDPGGRRQRSPPRRRRAGTQYLSIPDDGAVALVGSRPGWLWGFEHGINEHRVAIGNEKVWTVDDPRAAPPGSSAWTGSPGPRTVARRRGGRSHTVTTLLERHGQGGSGRSPATSRTGRRSSWPIPRSAWILETSGTTWVAAPVEGGGATRTASRSVRVVPRVGGR